MEGFAMLLLFWYGILHAFGPDHLTAIADFSIGKSKSKTLFITFAFAIGHGLTLFLFAKALESMPISPQILKYGDLISSVVIILIGIYLLFMAVSDRINVGVHEHEGKEHIHIWFGKEHTHNEREFKGRVASALTLGALMGAGGVRGMLVTLSAISHHQVNFKMILAFTLGVMSVFMLFGYFLAIVNENLLKSRQNVRMAFGAAGVVSLIVGSSMLM